jgi:hypothetical protein
MATRVNELMECDRDGKPATKTFTVSANGHVAVVDLCDACAVPVEELMALGTSGPRRRGDGQRKRPGGHAVVAVD